MYIFRGACNIPERIKLRGIPKLVFIAIVELENSSDRDEKPKRRSETTGNYEFNLLQLSLLSLLSNQCFLFNILSFSL